MKFPSNSAAHRDCCIGVSFPLVALEKYPDWRKKSARLIEVQKALMEIQGLLEVGALTAGERRDMQAACEAARIWHCHASPRKNPKLEDIWTSPQSQAS